MDIFNLPWWAWLGGVLYSFLLVQAIIFVFEDRGLFALIKSKRTEGIKK